MTYTARIIIRLEVEGDPTPEKLDALHNLACIMDVQAEDGLYTYGSPDSEPPNPPGDADPYPENEFLAHLSTQVDSITITAPPWHKGDVVQTQVPYDDFPITVVRMSETWMTVVDAPNPANNFTDAEIDEWIKDGAAIVKIRQHRPESP